MQHNFDVEIAEEYGVDEAIMINNLAFWILKNQASKKHIHDGYYWTYNSAKSFSELFPYWSEKQIYRIVKSLKDKKVIKIGNFNKVKYDQTKWYTIVEESILLKYKLHFTKRANGISEKGEPIPDSKPDKKHILAKSPKKDFQHAYDNEEEEKNDKLQKALTYIAKHKPGVVYSGDQHKPDYSPPKKKEQLTGWQKVYYDLVGWYEKEYGQEVIGWQKQYSHLMAIRKLKSVSPMGYDGFKEEIQNKMDLLSKEDWHKGRFDFGTLVSQWHKLKSSKKPKNYATIEELVDLNN